MAGFCTSQAALARLSGFNLLAHLEKKIHMRRCHTRKHENSRARCMLPPLLGERAEVRAKVSSNLIFGAGGSHRRIANPKLIRASLPRLPPGARVFGQTTRSVAPKRICW